MQKESDEEGKVENQRVRVSRRNGLRNFSQSQDQESMRRQQNRRRLRQVIHSGETSQFEERFDDQSNFGEANRRNIVMDSESEDEAPKRRSSR